MTHELHIITPVKDSLDTAEQTIISIMTSKVEVPLQYTVYNDNSTPENTQKLTKLAEQYHFNLVNISDITSHPSPNYLLALQLSQQKALDENAHLIIVESDVVVKEITLQELSNYAEALPHAGILGAVTTDEKGEINYPYFYAQSIPNTVLPTRKRISFCCSLITNTYLQSFDFHQLDASKAWYDVFLSHKSLKLGFSNYILTTLPVLHRPHASRPWKQLKYTHPLKYYYLKLFKGLDKI